ncbi:MAG: Rrf2 family transcriptional regulator [bacterium]
MALQLSTRGRYGVRAVRLLADRYGNGPISIHTIAAKERIPIRYLEQIMTRLRREGILNSIRGPGGGYQLTASPDRMSVGRVIQALEGTVSVARCVDENQGARCSLQKTCTTRDFWKKLSQTIQHILDNVTLQELVQNDWKENDLKTIATNRDIG